MKKILILISAFSIIVILLFSYNIMWRSPSYYTMEKYRTLDEPIMDMTAYEEIWKTHRRPYIFSVKSKKGKGEIHILGVEHIRDPNHPQFDTIRSLWNTKNPTVALVEGRMGFLFTWIQNPIKKYGESGLTSSLSRRDGADLFTWEPTKDGEIEMLMRKYPTDKLAMFYAFRPYFSNMRHGKPQDPEKKLQEYLESRTNHDHLRNIFKSWEGLDSIWQVDFPDIEWRDFSDGNGWPKGYLHDIWNDSNLARDEHMINVAIALAEKGEVVFITMGSSHAPRIESTLKKALE